MLVALLIASATADADYDSIQAITASPFAGSGQPASAHSRYLGTSGYKAMVDASVPADSAEGFSPGLRGSLAAGEAVELILEFKDTSGMAAQTYSGANSISLARPLKSQVFARVALRGVEEVHDYAHLPMSLVRVRSFDAVETLRRDEGVAAVYENIVLHRMLNQSLPLIDQPAAIAAGATGKGATVAVLDSGVDYQNPTFGSCASPGPSCSVVYAEDFAAEDGMRDDDGHGTNVAGIVLGVAPEAKIAALDVFDHANASASDIIAAIDWTISNQAAYNIVAMNLSLGAGGYFGPCTDSVFATPLGSARAAGILPVAASGNDGYTDALSAPACVPSAVSVGAVYDANVGGIDAGICTDPTTAADKPTCFSNSASFLDLLAPGAMIEAAGLVKGGTSQASPHVAGAVAAIRSLCPDVTPAQAASALATTGVKIKDQRNGLTFPRIDVGDALQSLRTDGGGCIVAADPDLVISSFGLSSSRVNAGSKFQISSAVANSGGAASAATTLRYGVWVPEAEQWQLVCEGSVQALASGAQVGQSCELTAPSATSKYYFLACVDAVAGEADSTNNCSTVQSLAVLGATAADFVVTEVSAGASAKAGEKLFVSTTIRNQGNTRSDSAWVAFMYSVDNTISVVGDVYSGWGCETSELKPGEGVVCSGEIPVLDDLPPGSYFVGIYADPGDLVVETNESNNTRAALGSTQIEPSANARLLSVSKAGTGSGSVSSTNLVGIACGGDCSQFYPLNSDVTLKATPLTGSTFGGWGGACAGTQSICDLTMDGAKTVTASFTRIATSPNPVTRSYAGTDCGAFINSQADKLERQQARIYNPASNPQSLWVICPLAAPVPVGGGHEGAAPGDWSYIDGRVNIFWNTGAVNGSRVDCAIRQYGFDNTHLPGVSQAGVLSVTTLASVFSAAAGPPYVDGVDFALSSPQGGFNYMTASCLLPPGAGVNAIEVEFGEAP